ncbi:MAG: alpha/beta fold hydrolase [Nocardioidaceae bacterium]
MSASATEPVIDFVLTADGRRLEVMTSGPADGFPLVFHNGTPSAVVPFPPLDRAVAAAGLRMVTYSRPGYGASTPRPDAERPGAVADDVPDTVAILDALGVDEFVTLGWSGGGPRALACAALLPERCRGAVSLAGVAPYGVDGLDWFADMGPENVRDFTAALEGEDALRPLIEAEVAELAQVTAEDIVAAFGELVSEVDAAALTGEFAEFLAADFRRSREQGAVGLLDDTLVLAQPWGFDVGSITVPVAVWQGRHDRMVPFGHGRWLADAIPGARRHLYDDEGHLTLVNQLDRILADLRDLAVDAG